MNLKDNARQELVGKMEQVYCRDDKHKTMNCAMIDCDIGLVDFGKLINFKRFGCFSYSESWHSVSGLLFDRELDYMFHFSACKNYIMLYPVHNKDHNAVSYVDFFELITKKVDKNARLFLYGEYQEVKEKEKIEFDRYMEEQERKARGKIKNE